MALALTLPDGNISTVCVDSWSTCEEVSYIIIFIVLNSFLIFDVNVFPLRK